jgi:hypothetical protein
MAFAAFLPGMASEWPRKCVQSIIRRRTDTFARKDAASTAWHLPAAVGQPAEMLGCRGSYATADAWEDSD